MSSFFFRLGKRLAPAVLKGRWLYHSAVGDETDAIRAEYLMGCQLAASYQSAVQLDRDLSVRQLLRALQLRLVPCVRSPQRQFAFRCVLTDERNAFALPGGFIYVSRPMLEFCGFVADEVAFVLGHEIAHVVYRHAADRVFALSVTNLATRIVAGGHPVVNGIVAKLIAEGYSRSQELEADAYAGLLVRAARFDPRAALGLLQRLQRACSGPSALGAFFASHPPFDERVENLRQTLRI
ncbi:MAG: M48 family metallopeptidase [Verrucomicrobiae bacterium]|nr:M48 family metallopeptidase [Verrucomicrobiae bacterium]